MKIIDTDGENKVYDLKFEYNKAENRHMLNWLSKNFSVFMIVVGNTNEVIDIKKNPEIERIIEDKKGEILEYVNEVKANKITSNDISYYNENGDLRVSLYSFNMLKREAGYEIGERVGIYSVYGFDVEDDEIVVTYQNNNRCKAKVQITFEIQKIYEEDKGESGGLMKGLSKLFGGKKEEPKKVYSGCCKISNTHGIGNIIGSEISYGLGNKLDYPVPQTIVNNGGDFYIKCDENDHIDFKANNIDYLDIKIEENGDVN